MSNALRGVVVALTTCAVAACGGEKFTAGTGGAGTTGGAGGASGSSATGGAAGAPGGAGGCPTLAAEGQAPSTPVLDDFDRADGPPGGSWLGASNGFKISNQQLVFDPDFAGQEPQLLYQRIACPDQEAYFRLVAFATDSAENFGLQLKSQDESTCEQIEVVYRPAEQALGVWTCEGAGSWVSLVSYQVGLNAGDVLGARARANGNVEVYANQLHVGTISVGGWLHAAKGGRIGVTGYNVAAKIAVDDFGGS